jgi:hypothetical protein
MSEFKLTQEKLPAIASELGINDAQADELFRSFAEFYENVRLQHLSSVMRALELHIRKKHGKPLFRIVWGLMDGTSTKDGVGLLWPNKYGIAIPPESDIKQCRNYVAHELGHLFYLTEHPENKGDKDLNQKMANVFGVFTMLERNEFYKEKAPAMAHSSWMQVVKDFTQLSNREDRKYNISN